MHNFLIKIQVEESTQRAYLILHFFNCLNSCVNPLIFAFAMKTFRVALYTFGTGNGVERALHERVAYVDMQSTVVLTARQCLAVYLL